MNQEWMRNVALSHCEITGYNDGRDSEADEKRKCESNESDSSIRGVKIAYHAVCERPAKLTGNAAPPVGYDSR